MAARARCSPPLRRRVFAARRIRGGTSRSRSVRLHHGGAYWRCDLPGGVVCPGGEYSPPRRPVFAGSLGAVVRLHDAQCSLPQRRRVFAATILRRYAERPPACSLPPRRRVFAAIPGRSRCGQQWRGVFVSFTEARIRGAARLTFLQTALPRWSLPSRRRVVAAHWPASPVPSGRCRVRLLHRGAYLRRAGDGPGVNGPGAGVLASSTGARICGNIGWYYGAKPGTACSPPSRRRVFAAHTAALMGRTVETRCSPPRRRCMFAVSSSTDAPRLRR